MDIANILNREPGNYLSDIFNDIEMKIVNNEIDNVYEEIRDYILKNY